MSDAIVDSGAVELSSEPISTEIGSGEVETAATEDADFVQPAEGEAEAEVSEELVDALEEAVEEGATEEEIQELIETFKIKVNGQEKDVVLDWNNKEDIIRRLQMAEAGQSAMQHSAEMERNFEQSLQNLMDNPWDALAELGLDPDQLAEQRIQQQIDQLQKSPEQLAQEEKDTELEELRQMLKKQQEEKEEAEYQQIQVEVERDLDQQITEALSSTTELPKSPYVVKRIADAMLTAHENGYEDVQAKDVLPWVTKEINEEMQHLFDAMPDKLLEKYVGNKTIDRLRQGRLSKMKAQPVGKIRETGKQAPVESAHKKNIKLKEWLKHGSSIKDFE